MTPPRPAEPRLAAGPTTRRRFFQRLTGALAGGVWLPHGRAAEPAKPAAPAGGPFFATRGVVLVPDDFTLADWPERAHRARLTTIGLHHGVSPQLVVDFIRSERGQRFLDQCRRLGLQVEYELHAMRELLPRALFEKQPQLFRLNDQGARTPDANLCVHSERALETVAENALTLARALRPTTGRFFFWGDDGQPWCRCANCRGLADADQALVLENAILKALRGLEPAARLAHLAYSNTIAPPKQIKPAPGVFLEYAPIQRRYDLPYAAQTGPGQPDAFELLDANLAVFGAAHAQVLEYWLDVSRFSHWKRPAAKLPWDEKVFAADLDAYGRRGIRHITSFAVFIDAEYVQRHGEPPLEEYGRRLEGWRAGG